MGETYKAEVQENADIKKDNKLSADELRVIEDLKIPNPEETALSIEKKTDDYLKTILSDCKDIINATSTAENNSEQVKAILTFLKVQSFYGDGISLDFSGVDIKNGSYADLVKLLGYNYNRNLLKVAGGDLGDKLVSLVDEIFSRYKDNVTDKIKKKPADPESGGGNGGNTPEGGAPGGEIATPSEGAEVTEEEFKFDNTTAVLYLTDIIGPISEDTIKNPKEVSKQYKIVMEKINSDKNFVNALNTLLKNFNIGTDIVFDQKTKKSEAITAFQNQFLEDDGNGGEKVNDAGETLYGTNVVSKVVDGRLGIRTMNAIINWEKTKDLLAGKGEEKHREVTVVNEKKENLDDKGAPIPEIPRTMNELRKYGNYSKEGGFVFHGENSEEGGDFVKTDPDGKKFVSIGETPYYLDDDSKENFVKREHKKVEVEKYGDIVTEYHDSIKIGKMDGDSFIGQEFILVDGKPKESLYSWPGSKREDGSQFKTDIVRGNLDDSENPDSHYDSKWRIDLFDEKGKDTMRLSKEQLNSLTVSDVSGVLEQAMILYEKTNHKPSEVGRYNLNRIVYSVMKRTDGFRNLNPEFDTPKTVSHMILGMDSGFFSDPSKKLKKSDINDITDEKLMKMLNIKKEEVVGYNDKMRYDGTMKKCDQIINRLRILKAFVDDPKNKWEVKKN